MKVHNQFPVGQLVGTVKNSGLVFWRKNGLNFARANTVPSNPRSEDQVKIRSYLTAATKNWYLLTQSQRNDWQAYADQYYRTDAEGNAVTPSGISTYLRANSIRQVLGLALTTAAPVLAPPAPLAEIAQVAGEDAGTVAITLTHSYTVLTGLSVIVRATPAMSTIAVNPTSNKMRYVRGVGAASAQALPASGSDLLFTPSKFSILDGQRFGVEARIVRVADGIMSNPVEGDFIKSI